MHVRFSNFLDNAIELHLITYLLGGGDIGEREEAVVRASPWAWQRDWAQRGCDGEEEKAVARRLGAQHSGEGKSKGERKREFGKRGLTGDRKPDWRWDFMRAGAHAM